MQTTWFEMTFRSERKYLWAIGETLHNGRKMHETLVQRSATSFKFEVCHSINDCPFEALVLLNVIICLKTRLRQKKKNYLTNIKSTTWPLHCNLLDFLNLGKLLRTSLVTYHTSFGRELTFLLSWGLVERLPEFPVHLKTINRENWKKVSQTYFWRRSGRRQRIKERENRGHVILWQAVTYLWKNISIMIKKFKIILHPWTTLTCKVNFDWDSMSHWQKCEKFSHVYWLKDLPLFPFIDILFSSYWKTTRNKYVSGQSLLFHLVLV